MCKYGSKCGLYHVCCGFARKETYFCIIFGLYKFGLNPFFSSVVGVHISQDLTWTVHCDAVIKKANGRLYAIRALKKSGVATKNLVLVYCSLIDLDPRALLFRA